VGKKQAKKNAPKQAKRAGGAKRNENFATRVRGALDELGLAAWASAGWTGAGRSNPDDLLTRLDAALTEAVRKGDRIDDMRTSIEDLEREFAGHGDHIRACRIEFDSAHHQALARISAIEADVGRRAAQLTKTMTVDADEHRARMEQQFAQSAEQWDHAQVVALGRVERAVQETGEQARAALHRSTDRIGMLLAAVEAHTVEILESSQEADVLDEGDPPELWTTGIDSRDVEDVDGICDVTTDERVDASTAQHFPDGTLDAGPLTGDEFGFGEPFDATVDRIPPHEDHAPLCWPPETSPGPETGAVPWQPTTNWVAPEPASAESDTTVLEWASEGMDDVGVPGDTRPPPPRNGRVVAVESAPPIAPAEATVTVQTLRLLEAVEALTRPDAEHLHAEIVRRVEEGTARAVLRLTVPNPDGWWDIRDVPVRTRAVAVPPVVLLRQEIVDVLTGITKFGDLEEVHLTFDATVRIAGQPVALQALSLVPAPPEPSGPIERVNLRTARESGLAVETADGWIAITPGLIAHLRADELTEVEVSIAGENPVLTARRPDPKDRFSARCVATLHHSTEEYPTLDRRNAAANAAEQLLAVLSTDTTSDELERMLKVGVSYVRRRAAAHPMLAPDLIATILESSDDAMRTAAASNPSLDPDACHIAAADRSMEVRGAAAANPALPATLLATLATDTATHVRLHAARNPRAESEILTRLAHDENPEVRVVVASRAGADADAGVLRSLSGDVDPRVCAAVAANPRCPADLLEELVSIAPLEALSNPQAPEALLTAASLLDTAEFRAAVASNPATPAAVLTRLARDQDDQVLRAVGNNPVVPSRLRKSAQRRLPRE